MLQLIEVARTGAGRHKEISLTMVFAADASDLECKVITAHLTSKLRLHGSGVFSLPFRARTYPATVTVKAAPGVYAGESTAQAATATAPPRTAIVVTSTGLPAAASVAEENEASCAAVRYAAQREPTSYIKRKK